MMEIVAHLSIWSMPVRRVGREAAVSAERSAIADLPG